MIANVPPQNLDAEESILGAILLSPSAIDTVSDVISPDDFYRESHAAIYTAALELNASGKAVDPITLANHLDQIGQLERVGGAAKIAELAALVPAASNVAHYAGIVAEMAALRRLIRAGSTITRLAQEREGDLDTIRARAEEAMTAAVQHDHRSTTSSLTEGLEELLSDLRHAYKTGEAMTGLLTGFRTIDELLLGLWPGQLILIAARPAQGKSTLALNIAENLSDRDICSLFFTLEMSKFELQIRSLSRAARIDSRNLITGQLTLEEATRMAEGVEAVKKRSAMQIDHEGSATVQRIAATAARLKRNEKLELLVVDYLQLVTPTGTSDNMAAQIGSISRGLKQIAMRLEIPVIAVSQMSRAIETRQNKRPQLSDLRDSGSLEQDADVVIFLHDESSYDTNIAPNGEVEVIVAKNRRGPTGNKKILYTRKYSRFHDMPVQQIAEAAA